MTVDVVVKILAVAGGGVIGGLALGLLAQLLTRAFTVQKLPRRARLVVQFLGGLICGWLVALWVFGGGGSGIGGLGGLWPGSGSGKGDGDKTTEVAKKDGNGKKTGNEAKAPADQTLRIEVLGDDPLKKLAVDVSRCYRLDTGEGPRLMTFAEVKGAIKKRQEKRPPLRRIEIVLYKDSPEQRVPLVRELRTWAGELDGGKMKVDFGLPDANAPIK